MSFASCEVRRRFWRAIRTGLIVPAASAAAGVSTRTGRCVPADRQSNVSADRTTA